MDFYEFNTHLQKVLGELTIDDRLKRDPVIKTKGGKTELHIENLLRTGELYVPMLEITLYTLLNDKKQRQQFEQFIHSLLSVEQPSTYQKAITALQRILESFHDDPVDI